MTERWYFVEGINPEPWKAPEGSIGRKKGGMFIQFHSPLSVRTFHESFADEFKRQNPDYELIEGPVQVTFYVSRQVSEYDADTGRKARANVADSTNMLKLLEDSLQGILYENDQANKDVRCCQVMQGPHAEPMVLIHILPFPGIPTDILRHMYERREQVVQTRSNTLPDERGADGLF